MDRSKPEIEHPEGPAPTELVSTDEIVGDGDEAGRGDVVDVHYLGVSHSTGEPFDASWDRGEPLRFQLGVGQVISGWDQGVQGIEGRRPPPARDPRVASPTATWAPRRSSRPASR